MSTTTSFEFEIANFVCKFNENNLMDLFEEVVLPAFHRDDKWKIANGTFFFKDVSMISYQTNDELYYALAGKFIRNTVLRRQQYHDDVTGELIQDDQSLPSSPSAFFVLILNNHRLIYLKETKHAPTLEMFRSTAETFLKRETRDYASTLNKEEKKDLLLNFGLPSVRITPLTSDVRLAEFIKSYKKLETVKVTLKVRNDENDYAGFIDELQERSTAANSQSTNLLYENKTTGLNKDVITQQLSDMTQQGNQSVRLVGLSENDEVLKGDNENFKILQSINGIDLKDILSTGNKLIKRFKDLVDKKQITLPKTNKVVIDKLSQHNDFVNNRDKEKNDC